MAYLVDYEAAAARASSNPMPAECIRAGLVSTEDRRHMI